MESVHLRIYCRCTELLLDAEKLIVLGDSFASAGSTGLDLACIKSYCKISDGSIGGLSGTVRGDGAQLVADPVIAHEAPDDSILSDCRALGRSLA